MKKTKTNKKKPKKLLSRKNCQQFSDLFFQRNKKLKFSPKISQKGIGSFETLNKSVKTNSKLTKKLGGTVHLGVRTWAPRRMSTEWKRLGMSLPLIWCNSMSRPLRITPKVIILQTSMSSIRKHFCMTKTNHQCLQTWNLLSMPNLLVSRSKMKLSRKLKPCLLNSSHWTPTW